MSVQSIGTILQSLHCTNLSDLSGYLYAQPGYIAWVDTLSCKFVAVPSNTSISDGYVVLDGQGVQWQRIIGSSASKWLSQDRWYIDGTLGNDENDGYTSVTALKTCNEIQRRWGGADAILSNTITINVLTSNISINLIARRFSSIAQLKIIGTVTRLVTLTVSSYTDKSPSTNEGNILDGGSGWDWTPYIGKRLYFVTGAAYSWIEKVNPAGGGVRTARIASCYKDPVIWSDFIVPTRYIPINGETIYVEDLLVCSCISVDYDNAASGDASGINQQLIIHSLKTSTNVIIKGGNWSAAIALCACDFQAHMFFSAERYLYIVGINQRLKSTTLPSAVLTGGSLIGTNSVSSAPAGNANQTHLLDVLCQGCGINVRPQGSVSIEDCQIFDAGSAGHGAVFIYEGAMAFVVGTLSGYGSGSGSGYGVYMYNTSKLVYVSGIKPTITGALGDILVSGPNFIFSWADIPRSFNQYSGTATLTSGISTIISKNIPTDAKINYSRNTPIGAVGDLSCSQSTRTNLGTVTSQFIINSTSSSDDSTIDWGWVSPSMGNGGIFSR